MIRYWLFRLYGWIALVASAAAIAWAMSDDKNWLQILTGAGATILGFCYFVQQQKLAETELFHNLFSAFNARYDALNGCLADILNKEEEITPAEKKKIVDYFNLCAEEYLFYKEGYIHPEAWTSWCRGMLWYLRRRAFRNVWNEEVETESFYGLTLDEIQKGAKHSGRGK
jgi:hypothetical protein